MNIYRGTQRRQVGGGLFSTIARGARPFFQSLFNLLKPHAKTIGKRAAKAALNVGTDLAVNTLAGKMNKRNAKDIISKEADKLRGEAGEAIKTYKRKLNEQMGSGAAKKRKTNNPKMAFRSKSKTLKTKSPKRRTTAKRQKRINKQAKSKQNKSKRRVTKKRTNRKTKKFFKDIFSK